MQGGIRAYFSLRINQESEGASQAWATTTCSLSVDTFTGILKELSAMTSGWVKFTCRFTNRDWDPDRWSNSLPMLPPGTSYSIRSAEISEWL